MPKNRYYYYDHETCTFVALKPRRSKVVKKAASTLLVATILAGMLSYTVDRFFPTPHELELRAENLALQNQLETMSERVADFSKQIDALSEHDQTLYRTLLQAEPISDDVRQMGVGGAAGYEQFEGYSASTSKLLRTTAMQLDELERKVSLQSRSFRELGAMAKTNQTRLEQLPAIVPANGPLVSGYGMRRHPILRVRKMHHGIDVLVNVGTPVVAAGAGVVKRIGRGAGYGKFIEIEHPEAGYTTLYAHLSDFADGLRKGQRVERGQEIAFSGNTGRSSGPHLHFEVRDADGRTLNPLFFLAPSMTPEQYARMLDETDQSAIALD